MDYTVDEGDICQSLSLDRSKSKGERETGEGQPIGKGRKEATRDEAS